MSAMPFAGVRIVDFTHEWAGPIGTRILGDFGADVIKVEYAPRMCVLRGAFVENARYNTLPRWHQVNRNKRSVTLDLKIPEDLETFKDLVRVADIVVNNSRPVVMERLGLRYPELKRIKPDIILVTLPAFGATGPYASFAGFGGTIEPLAGLQSLTAYEKGGQQYRIREMDVTNGLMGACALVTALVYRHATGEGQWIDLSQFEAATHALMGEHLLEFVINGTQTLPLGNRHAHNAPQGCYRCRGEDKWVTITVRTDEEWHALCGTLGHPEWADDPRFATREARRAHHDALDRLIEAWTLERGHYEAMDALQRAGVPAGAVLDTADLSKDPHLCARGYFISAENGSKGPFPGMQFGLSETPGRLFRRGPDLGQHNEEVFTTLLGYPPDQIKPLRPEEVGTGFEPE